MKKAAVNPTQGRAFDEELNEKFQMLLRDAAEKREARARTHSTEDAVAARQESADLLGLARDPGRHKKS
jgi:hypothetical protein